MLLLRFFVDIWVNAQYATYIESDASWSTMLCNACSVTIYIGPLLDELSEVTMTTLDYESTQSTMSHMTMTTLEYAL